MGNNIYRELLVRKKQGITGLSNWRQKNPLINVQLVKILYLYMPYRLSSLRSLSNYHVNGVSVAPSADLALLKRTQNSFEMYKVGSTCLTQIIILNKSKHREVSLPTILCHISYLKFVFGNLLIRYEKQRNQMLWQIFFS